MVSELLLFIIMIASNLIAALLIVITLRKKEAVFSLNRYFALLVIPASSLGYLIVQYGYMVLVLFVVFAIVGTLIEYVLGYTFYKMFHIKIWEYSLYSWSGFTSWLAIIPWGFYGMTIFGAGIVVLQLFGVTIIL